MNGQNGSQPNKEQPPLIKLGAPSEVDFEAIIQLSLDLTLDKIRECHRDFGILQPQIIEEVYGLVGLENDTARIACLKKTSSYLTCLGWNTLLVERLEELKEEFGP